MASASDVVISSLGSFIKTNVPALSQVFLDFPAPNQKLQYPSLTIIQGKPVHDHVAPYVLSKGAVIAAGNPDAGKTPVRRVVGKYEFNLQLDLWTRSKDERHRIYDLIYKTFHKTDPGGISLKLVNYYNIWARYDLKDYDFGTDEAESQRAEWRAKIKVVANCFSVIETNDYLIQTIENNLETPVSIDLGPIPGSPGGQII